MRNRASGGKKSAFQTLTSQKDTSYTYYSRPWQSTKNSKHFGALFSHDRIPKGLPEKGWQLRNDCSPSKLVMKEGRSLVRPSGAQFFRIIFSAEWDRAVVTNFGQLQFRAASIPGTRPLQCARACCGRVHQPLKGWQMRPGIRHPSGKSKAWSRSMSTW